MPDSPRRNGLWLCLGIPRAPALPGQAGCYVRTSKAVCARGAAGGCRSGECAAMEKPSPARAAALGCAPCLGSSTTQLPPALHSRPLQPAPHSSMGRKAEPAAATSPPGLLSFKPAPRCKSATGMIIHSGCVTVPRCPAHNPHPGRGRLFLLLPCFLPSS